MSAMTVLDKPDTDTSIKFSSPKERDDYVVKRVIEDDKTLRDVAIEVDLSAEGVRQIILKSGESIRDARRAANPFAGTRVCGVCGERYKNGTYADHCQDAGHRQLIPPGEKVERNKRIVDLYVHEGYNTTEIAESENVPQPVVTRILHRANIRPIGRRRRKGGLTQVKE